MEFNLKKEEVAIGIYVCLGSILVTIWVANVWDTMNKNSAPSYLDYYSENPFAEQVNISFDTHDYGVILFNNDSSYPEIRYPKYWAKGLKKIEIVNCSRIDDLKPWYFICDKSDAGGIYDDGSIYLAPSGLSYKGFKRSVYHELGHNIWYNILNESFRDRWCDTYDNQTEHITRYSYTRCREDFADSFEAYYYSQLVMQDNIGLMEEVDGIVNK
jgi:hypothetical protein